MPRPPLRFVKMHGAGNDYVYLDARQPLPADLPALARQLSDRHAGVGGDGVILVAPPVAGGDVRMVMFNADGSEGAMCGNGVRCVAKFAADRGMVPAGSDSLVIETASGPRRVGLVRDGGGAVVGAGVDMGRPDVGETIELPGVPGRWSLVSTGNPHAVTFVDDLAAIDWPTVGPAVAGHGRFPGGVNAHAVRVRSPERFAIVHWERGSGPTLACGTGACAALAAAVTQGLCGRRVTAEVPGGELALDWPSDDGPITMTGPAVEVFAGELS